MKQTELTRNMKRKLLAAVTVGVLDLEQHPELMQACVDQMSIKPISRETAKNTIKEL